MRVPVVMRAVSCAQGCHMNCINVQLSLYQEISVSSCKLQSDG